MTQHDETIEKVKVGRIRAFFHTLTHHNLSLMKDEIGEINLCFTRFRSNWTRVTLIGDDQHEQCQVRIPTYKLPDLVREFGECENANQVHLKLHLYRAEYES